MENILSLTEFIRHLKSKPLGYSLIWYVPSSKTYATVTSNLTSIAVREGCKISTAKGLLVEEGKPSIASVIVTRK